MNPEEIREITKSRITPNLRRQPPEQSQKGGMVHRRSRSPSPLSESLQRLKHNRHPSPIPRPSEDGVVSLVKEEKNEVHLHVLTAAIRVPTKRKPRCNQGSIIIGARRPGKLADIRRVKTVREVTVKSKSRRHRSNTYEDDLSQPWTCEERNPFTPRIRHFNFPRTRMPSHVKTYDGSGDPKDHLKLFQAAAKTERWAMPTWCHMFNSTLTGNARVWFDKLPRESIDNY
ncbi:hypothetical protein Tco_0562606 [Tanacetum coccineum]